MFDDEGDNIDKVIFAGDADSFITFKEGEFYITPTEDHIG